MARATISFAESAMSDLEEIVSWYRAQGVPEQGTRLVTEIVARIETLADHPEIGRIVPEFDQPFLRELIHGPFRIVCRRDPDRARMVRVWRGERPLRLAPEAGGPGS